MDNRRHLLLKMTPVGKGETMFAFKCKMCGGTLKIQENQTIAVCEYCGTTQTLPKLDDDWRANLYDRANHFRRNDEFDKAINIYEKILNEDSTDAEAYWSLVLCRYGIEYVEDPVTHKQVPTINRTQYTSIFDDDNYKSALKYADSLQKAIYESEAAAINEIQKGILDISVKEAPFDVFICYKETDDSGERTQDSVLANELYHLLTQEGFNVFFSRITLEDKLGTAYEPYIFAALNSAKVMVVIGTKPEHFNSAWVKNEWSRYLALIKNGAKKVLIPAYRDMDPYDLPEEFSHLQAQDMSKLGFMQDLIRGIRKLTDSTQDAGRGIAAANQQQASNTAPLLERVFLFLEDGDWSSADEYCEKVLDIDPKNSQAYLGKLMAEFHCQKREQLRDCGKPFNDNRNYKKAIRFAETGLRTELEGYIEYILARNKNKRLEGIYKSAMQKMDSANTEEDYKFAANRFQSIADFRDAGERAKICTETAENLRKDRILSEGIAEQSKDSKQGLERAMKHFEMISGWKDADERRNACKKRAEEIELLEEQERILEEKQEKRRKRNTSIVSLILVCSIGFVLLLTKVIIPSQKYNAAAALRNSGDYEGAIAAFTALEEYKDVQIQVLATYYAKGQACLEAKDYAGAVEAFSHAKNYEDAERMILATYYAEGQTCLEAKDYVGAVKAFSHAKKYEDAERMILATYYAEGQTCLEAKDYARAAISFGKAGDFKDAKEKIAALRKNGFVVEMNTIAAGAWHTIGLRSDGSVVAVGWNVCGQCEVSGWSDIVAVAAGSTHTVGLKTDGTIVAAGQNKNGETNISNWSDIVEIVAKEDRTVGLKSDGTVVAVGENEFGGCEVSGWSDILAVATGKFYTVGLNSDGTVVSVGVNEYKKSKISSWTDIIAITSGTEHIVGLRSDGRVVAVGNNKYGECNVLGWTDIVAVAAGSEHTVGLKLDGRVVAVGDNSHGECKVSNWTDIVAVTAGEGYTVGLKSDGTVVSVGYNGEGQCNVSNWKDIRVPG